MLEFHIGECTFGIAALELHNPRLLCHPFRVRGTESDIGIFRQIFVAREYDFPFPFQPRTIVDAGAHIGCASVWLAQKYPAATIIALEPAPDNFELLSTNCQWFPGITPLRAGLWNRTARLQLLAHPVPGSPAQSDAYQVREITAPAGPDMIEVKALTLSDIFAMHAIQELDILKLDVEGAEIEVLSEASDAYLARTRAIVVEPHDRLRAGCMEAIQGAARRHGFKISALGEYLYLTRGQS